MDEHAIQFVIKFQKRSVEVQLPLHSTISQLKQHLHETLDVAPQRQKLLSKVTLSDDMTLEAAGICNGSKVLLVASSEDEVQQVTAPVTKPTVVPLPTVSAAAESAKQRKREAALKPSRIKRLEVLELPEKEFAMTLLQKIHDDRGIKAILEKHNWHIGLLKELTPLEQKIAGYNRNRGMEIAVKLRHLDYQSWRSWPDIMETMLHELAHCDHDEHDAKFFKLNRELNKEVKALNWQKGASQKLGGDLDAYNPNPLHVEDSLADPETVDWRAATKRSSGQTLGGESKGLEAVRGLAPGLMAGLMAEIRLTQREQELVGCCGTVRAGAEPERLSPADAPHAPALNSPPAPDGTAKTKSAASPAPKSAPEPAMTPAPEPASGPADPTLASKSEAGPDSQPSPPPNPGAIDAGDTPMPDSSSAASPKAEAVVLPCPICGFVFPPGTTERYVSNHIEQCLAAPPPAAPCSDMAVDGPEAGAQPQGAAEGPACPLCGLAFPPDASERYMTNHVEQCVGAQ